MKRVIWNDEVKGTSTGVDLWRSMGLMLCCTLLLGIVGCNTDDQEDPKNLDMGVDLPVGTEVDQQVHDLPTISTRSTVT